MVFERLKNSEEIKDIIRQAFSVDMDISGGWGYDEENPTIINLPNLSQKVQMQFAFAMMRATLEMNLTREKESRYGSINVKELSRESIGDVEKVTYEVSGMKESDYKLFIQEYKDGFGKDDFDIDRHFENRRKATLTREVEHYFKTKES